MVLGTVETPKNPGDEAINFVRYPAYDRQIERTSYTNQKSRKLAPINLTDPNRDDSKFEQI